MLRCLKALLAVPVALVIASNVGYASSDVSKVDAKMIRAVERTMVPWRQVLPRALYNDNAGAGEDVGHTQLSPPVSGSVWIWYPLDYGGMLSGPTNYVNARHVAECWKVTTGSLGETFTLDAPVVAWENGALANNNLSAYWYDDVLDQWNPIRGTTDTFGGPSTTDDGRVAIAASESSGVAFAHFVWHGITSSSLYYALYYARFNWTTHNFDIAPKQIASSTTNNYVFPCVVNRNNGQLWAFFERQNAASTPDNIYEIHSTDRGKTWTAPFQVNSGTIKLYAGWPLISAAAAHSAPRNEGGTSIMRGPSDIHLTVSTKSSASDSSWDIYHWWKLADEAVSTAWHQETVAEGAWTPTTTKDLMFPSIAVDAHGSPHIAYLLNYGELVGFPPAYFYNFAGTIYYGKRQDPAGSATGPTQWTFSPITTQTWTA